MSNKIIHFLVKAKDFTAKFFLGVRFFMMTTFHFVASWWRGIISLLVVITFLYYPIGAMFINNIDTNTDYNFTAPENPLQSQSLDIMAYMVDREVNQKTWTPNLPFFFPSAMLDNMPNFQLGMFDALASFSKSLQSSFSPDTDIKNISELLAYNGKIWMFSSESNSSPLTSANSMYRDARKKIRALNLSLAENETSLNKSPAILASILKKAEKNITKSVTALETHINEEKTSYIDTKSDEVFFYNQGKLYGYYLLLSALGQDYRDLIVNQNLYSRWTVLTKTLADASQINPMIVRNADINSSFSPNHLNHLAFYGMKADANILKIVSKLETIPSGTIQ